MANFYKALGLERNATLQEIATAYHRLSVLCEKDNYDLSAFPALTQKQYIELLNDAFKTLSDPEARAQYDAAYTTDLRTIKLPSLALACIQPIQPLESTPPPIHFPAAVQLAELFYGEKKKEITYQRYMNDRLMQQTLTLAISPYMRPGQTLTLPECGHHIGGRLGDLQVVLHLIAHPKYAVVGDDLVTDMFIPLSVALLGGTVEVRGFDEKRFTIMLTEGFPARPPLVKCIEGEGMKTPSGRGNLIVNFYVQFPKVRAHLHEEASILLRKIEQTPSPAEAD